MTTSLLPFSPDNALHGAEVTLKAQLANGSFVTIGELYGFDWDEDQGMVKVPAFGTRLTGERRGRYTVSGTFTGYYINGVLRSMIQGTVASGGAASAIYHSQATFQRYLIDVVPTANSAASFTGNIRFYNVTLGKDAMKMKSDTLCEEVVTWAAEDVFSD